MAKKPPSQKTRDALQAAYSLHQQNRLDEAWQLYEQLLARDPELPDALHLSGCVALQRGAHEEATRRIGAALDAVGPNEMYLVSYGNALAGANRHAEAESAYRRALSLNPASSAAHNNLGNLMVRLGRYEEAIAEFDQTLVHAPRHLNALLALGRLLAERKAFGPSLTLLRRARDIAPENEKVLIALARACFTARQYEAAMEAIEAACRVKPNSDEAHTGAGEILFMLKRYGESIASYRQALQLRPDNAGALDGLVATLTGIGRTAEAIDTVRRQVVDLPASPLPMSSLLFLFNYLHDMSAQELAAAHRDWNARFALPIATTPAFEDRDRDPERPLRVGYVSADFRTHSVAFFLEPIFEHHDRSRFEIYAYHNSTDFDAVTQRLKASVSAWRDVSPMSDQELAALIRSDAIDILVDLGGHTGHNRLLSFARQPAPVQVTYLGYPNTTGLSAIQYRISDAIADPPGSAEALSSEALLRLPECFHCYRPDERGTPDFSPPGGTSGSITFASFNVVAKINPLVIDAWSRILKRLPDARLLLKTRGFAEEFARAPVREAFASNGIAVERIVFDTHQDSRAEHMARYRQVDIALDTFPYGGTTTTCDALWMGVPVVTVHGDRHAARVGASLLHACGLDELVATDIDDYVERALRLAADRPRLAQLHGALRERMSASPLMDEPGFARKLEAAYRDVWRRWCVEKGSTGQDRLDAPHWQLRLAGDVSICIPASYTAMTPAVLLEQEDWFEAEVGFVRGWLQPGMQVIDIGANYGIYTLNAARRVGVEGRVWAFEPAPNTRRFLAASIAANGFAQVSIEAPALSDSTGEAWIQLNWNPELNSLVDGPLPGLNTERIAITTLDAWHGANPTAAPDFIKLDAEGHERRILAGGRKMLAKASPLIMFELKHGSQVNTGLVGDLEAMGFGIYQLLPGLGVLTPFPTERSVDPYALNLFACKPELAARLAAAGALALASALAPADMPQASGVDDIHLALAAHAEAMRHESPPRHRVARLSQALAAAQRACAAAPRPSRLHTLARVAWMSGARDLAVKALRQALDALDRGEGADLDEPFLPAAPRFDAIAVDDPRLWLEAATIERYLQLYCFAGIFAEPNEEQPLLERAAQLPHFSVAMERRRQLLRIGQGQQTGPECSPLLAAEGRDHLNPKFWCP